MWTGKIKNTFFSCLECFFTNNSENYSATCWHCTYKCLLLDFDEVLTYCWQLLHDSCVTSSIEIRTVSGGVVKFHIHILIWIRTPFVVLEFHWPVACSRLQESRESGRESVNWENDFKKAWGLGIPCILLLAFPNFHAFPTIWVPGTG